ncbi:HNH endonuclease family protein [Thalassolituus oleivorans]|uniref:HNH endonuclease family protein n=1 Tax=Thalassolituus oleivorans TaxID=187493 RepID=UPI0023F15295|nr:HNH endonuclease family protein [Thalassolituus oleivorans]
MRSINAYRFAKLLVCSISISLLTFNYSHALVKRSKSGICHTEQSQYFDNIKKFKGFETEEACLDSGGRRPKQQSPLVQPTVVQNSSYDRKMFGSGWSDDDKDCQNSRQEALISQSTAPVRFSDERRCKVSYGRWISPYSGNVIHNPKEMDIDHVVPLKWAWEHGASNWSKSLRIDFANDPVNLLSVEANLNRQKGASGLDEWLPPANQCQYIARFLRITKKYKLQLTETEKISFEKIKKQKC